ncbi:hypothetical protein LWC34_56430 [Kibdelosporangium philippinense]|uniref:Acetyltransferase (GNAT) domain-containing protein n=1 Tax=Kibdelosporangium philippinense TaxID=211113 RepID=A0ABS8ZWR6_9PSEU|nr:hypothetical protein [Kibdelosporangium philippinense]MCE7012143.1 hypothetical protein [Kibdelosporangium philippinense]
MPILYEPLLPSGSLKALTQPILAIDDRFALRPWRAEDVPVVRAAFDWPDIQRWHPRRMDSDEEALAWIVRWNHGWQNETEDKLGDHRQRPRGRPDRAA